jgi:asparagine synthase (glutamine-hydrolysing)
MCGLAASVKKGNEGKVQAAAELMSHRGNRMNGTEMIAHVRLPIVGVGEEHDQPVHAGDFTLAFVGEILDFRETNPSLLCDVDLVAVLWATQGPSCLSRRDGFWAVAAVHEPTRVLHLLCDYLGQKPLYYRLDEAAAASELDAVASFGPVTPDALYLSDVCKWGYCPDPRRTPYAEVSRVLPGEYVSFDARGWSVNRAIVDPLVPVRLGGAETGDRLKKEIEDATARRALSSDVPVACLLSGGFDSSLVYTLASRHRDVIPYFVTGKNLEGGDSVEDAESIVQESRINFLKGSPVVLNGRQIGQYMNMKLKTVHLDPLDYFSLQDKLQVMQEPVDLGSLMPQIALSSAVAERVCLTGDGADELFGGYSRALRYDSQASDVFQELVCWHLPRLDRVMMRNKIEVRSPFLARQVVQIALGLPYELRRGKAILRRLFKDDLPARIVSKGKVPLRAKDVDEAYRVRLVEAFVAMKWPKEGRI